MVHILNKKVVTLEEFGEERFIDLLADLKNQDHPSDSRNSDWFTNIPNQYKDPKYLDWFFLMDKDKFVAFSSVQEYDAMTFRCMTRTYVAREYRSLFSVRDHKAVTVTSYFLPAQLEYLGGWRSVFLSRQDPKRRRSFERTRGRAEYWTGVEWLYHPKLVKTLGSSHDINAWQNVIYNGEAPNLDKISIERYYELFPNQR